MYPSLGRGANRRVCLLACGLWPGIQLALHLFLFLFFYIRLHDYHCGGSSRFYNYKPTGLAYFFKASISIRTHTKATGFNFCNTTAARQQPHVVNNKISEIGIICSGLLR